MGITFDPGMVLGLIAAILSLSSFMQKRMFPLRAIAIFSNVFFIAYGYVDHLLPALFLHTCLLPLNAKRLWEIHRLTHDIKRAKDMSSVSEWLLPHMDRRSFKSGEVLFRKGDEAESVVYISRGEVKIDELNKSLGEGSLLGEVGLFSPEKKRTQTIVCATDGELYQMTDVMMYRLYYQNPSVGFYFMRLIAGRLMADIERARAMPTPP